MTTTASKSKRILGGKLTKHAEESDALEDPIKNPELLKKNIERIRRQVYVLQNKRKLQASTLSYKELGCNIFLIITSGMHVQIGPARVQETRTQIISHLKN